MEFLRELFQTSSAVDVVPLGRMVWATTLAFGLSLIIGYVYRVTHRGPSYSQTTVHTMVIMAVVVALIMMIIGSNIARAFSLVGALSIIRFRNAVKESRDVAFFFMTMAIGMACGTGFLALAAVFTLNVGVMTYLMTRFDVGAKPFVEVLLRLTLSEKVDYTSVFNEVFYKYLESVDLLSVDSDGTGTLELVYTVTLRKKQPEQGLLRELTQMDPSIQAQLIHGHSTTNL